MKNYKLKYLPLASFTDVLGVPMLTYKYLIRKRKNKDFPDILKRVIAEVKEESKRTEELTPIQVQRYLDDYIESDDFFSHYFKYSLSGLAFKSTNPIRDLTFNERIEYCLNRFEEEAQKIYTASNYIILEENFLNGAKHTLFIYFLFRYHGINIDNLVNDKITNFNQINQQNDFKQINQQNNLNIEFNLETIYNSVINNHKEVFHPNNPPEKKSKTRLKTKKKVENKENFKSLFREEDYKIFYSYLKEYFLNTDKSIKTSKLSSLSAVLRQLKSDGIIKNESNKQILKLLEKSLGIKISPSTYSGAKDYRLKDRPTDHIISQLSKDLGI